MWNSEFLIVSTRQRRAQNKSIVAIAKNVQKSNAVFFTADDADLRRFLRCFFDGFDEQCLTVASYFHQKNQK
jgi:hypothetical protein